MKKFSKFIALTLVCVLMLCALPLSASAVNGIVGNNPGKPSSDLDETNTEVPISAQVFDDVAPGEWYYEAVNAMGQSGLLAGYSDGLFHPNDIITYGQFATILCRITGTSMNHDPYVSIGHKSTHWAAGALDNICGKTNLFGHGCGNEDKQLWRGQALESMVCLATDMSKYHYSHDTQMTEKVWTWDDIPDSDVVTYSNFEYGWASARVQYGTRCWSQDYILYAYNLGITTGVDAAGTCNPTGTMTRAQLCQLLYNMGISEPNSVKVRGSGIK